MKLHVYVLAFGQPRYVFSIVGRIDGETTTEKAVRVWNLCRPFAVCFPVWVAL